MGNVFAYVSGKSNDDDETKVIEDHPKKLKPLKLNDDTEVSEHLTRPAFIEDGDNVSSPALISERNKDVPDGNVISNILVSSWCLWQRSFWCLVAEICSC